jgi:hypothetical protein
LVSRKFLATCWVMVEAPCGRRPLPYCCYVEHAGARDAGEVDAAVLVVVLVFGRDEGVGDELGHGLDREM